MINLQLFLWVNFASPSQKYKLEVTCGKGEQSYIKFNIKNTDLNASLDSQEVENLDS